MAEGTNEFLREIDELLGDEVTETQEKEVETLDEEPYVGAGRPQATWGLAIRSTERTS